MAIGISGSGGGPGSDTTAIHDNVDNEILNIDLKAVPENTDVVVIETATGVKKRAALSTLPTCVAGEANTASNQGTDGQGVFDAKNGIDLEFRNIAPASNKVTVVLNGKDIDLDIDATKITLLGTQSALVVGGSITRNVTTVNAATYDLLATDDIVHVTYTSTGAVTSLTLPTAQVVAGRTIVVKDGGGSASTNNITIDTEGTEKIDGGDTLVIATDYNSVNLYSDGTNFFVF